MNKINNNHEIDWKQELDPILDSFCSYVNKSLRTRNTCVVNFARCVYEYIEKNPNDNIVYDLNSDWGMTVNEVIAEFVLVAVSLLENSSSIKYIPQSEIQYLVVRLK